MQIVNIGRLSTYKKKTGSRLKMKVSSQNVYRFTARAKDRVEVNNMCGFVVKVR